MIGSTLDTIAGMPEHGHASTCPACQRYDTLVARLVHRLGRPVTADRIGTAPAMPECWVNR